jgi:hypothetical protein
MIKNANGQLNITKLLRGESGIWFVALGAPWPYQRSAPISRRGEVRGEGGLQTFPRAGRVGAGSARGRAHAGPRALGGNRKMPSATLAHLHG